MEESQNPMRLNNTYEIISKIAFLIGVRKESFDNDTNPLDDEWYHKLNQDKNARIVRNLCMLRTVLFKKYRDINNAIYYDLKNLNTLPNLVPQDILKELTDDGIGIIHANWTINQYIVFINSQLNTWIAGCRPWFPLWIEWQYIRNLFIIPKADNDKQLKNVWGYYVSHINDYPYGVFLNARPQSMGNLLYNDEKFVTFLYGLYGKAFVDKSKVSDASSYTKNSIYSFIEQSAKIAIVVDCENANPYKLYSMLDNLPRESSEKIIKMILYNDTHASSAWKLFSRFLNITIEHEMTERIKEDKSLVDIRLTAGTCREYYKNHIDSFILVSSDSDYWGLITAMEECRFMVMVEYDKCSGAIVNAMKKNDVPYCYLDNFCSGDLESIQAEALLYEIRATLKQHTISIDSMLNSAIRNTRAELSAKEVEQFKKRYLRKIQVQVTDKTISLEV